MNLEKHIMTLASGVNVLNTCKHTFVFEDGTTVEPCGILLDADLEATDVTDLCLPIGIRASVTQEILFESLNKKPNKEGEDFLETVPAINNNTTLVLGSLIAAEAYGFPVVAPKPNEKTASRKVRPWNKINLTSEFTAWPSNYQD